MAAGPDEVGLWTKLATGSAGMCVALVSLVWRDYRARVEKVEVGLSKKADSEMVETQRKETRETFIGVFAKIEELRKEVKGDVKDIKDDMNDKHKAVMAAIYSNGSDRRKQPRE